MTQDRTITVHEFLDGMPLNGILYFADLCVNKPILLSISVEGFDSERELPLSYLPLVLH